MNLESKKYCKYIIDYESDDLVHTYIRSLDDKIIIYFELI